MPETGNVTLALEMDFGAMGQGRGLQELPKTGNEFFPRPLPGGGSCCYLGLEPAH